MFIEPVFGKKFFGREEVLANLNKRVTALKGGYRQNMALAGPMLTGKSSILRHFLKNIDDPDIIPVYIEMEEENFDVFCIRMMATLLYRFLDSVGENTDGDLDLFRETARPYIPDTVKCIDYIRAALSAKKKNAAYEKLLGLTSVFKTETGKSCIVILDEFHNLSNFGLKTPFKTFGKFIMVQKNTMYIVSSSQRTLLKELLSKKLSLLFGNFEVIDIDGFDPQTARSFMTEKMRGVRDTEKIMDFMIQLCGGNPFYLELLSNRFTELNRQSGGKWTSRECLLEAFAGGLYESGGILNQYFTNNLNFFLEKKSRKKYIPVLLALAAGNSRLKEIHKYLGRQDKQLSSKLAKLQHMDLVYKSGVFYKIQDKLFEFWMRNVYNLRSSSMIDDMDIRYIEFKKLVGEEYDSYLAFASRPVDIIVRDLFSAFDKDKVSIRMHDRKLPKFDTVRLARISPGISELSARTGKTKWVCRMKTAEMADEDDINDLWKKRSDLNIVRKIFIPFKGIEHNAFLLAKEQNIWIWDTRELNNLLRIFLAHEIVS
ncbi:MAG: AAA family ATPase [Candidatus Omnitrophica bacterium]|nr:AAA family ATPase [Candidatus Omnitrophota bacterium]